jgi:hypothetical protein
MHRIRGGAKGLTGAWKEKMGISDSDDDSAAYANFPQLPAWKEEELAKMLEQGYNFEEEDPRVCSTCIPMDACANFFFVDVVRECCVRVYSNVCMFMCACMSIHVPYFCFCFNIQCVCMCLCMYSMFIRYMPHYFSICIYDYVTGA